MTETITEASTRRWFLRPPFLIAAAAVVAIAVVLAVLFIPSKPAGRQLLAGDLTLGRTDVSGAVACEELGEWLNGKQRDPKTGKPEDMLIMAIALSSSVNQSTTTGIRATASPVASIQAVNMADLDAACTAAGVTMPPFTTTPH